MTTRKGREFAFKVRSLRNKRAGRKCWHVGLTTSRYFWLDLNTPNFSEAYQLALILKDRLSTLVYVFETSKSFHLITKRPLDRQTWRLEYAWWLNNFDDGLVCHAFCLCCLKYNKATIRVSLKNGNRPKLKLKVGGEIRLLTTYSTKPISEGLRLSPSEVRIQE